MGRGPAKLYVGSTDHVAKKAVPVSLETDPTGTNPEFGFTNEDDDTPPGSWVAGSWHSDGFANEKVYALTPSLGAAGSGAGITFPAADDTQRGWIKFSNGADVEVHPCGYLRLYA